MTGLEQFLAAGVWAAIHPVGSVVLSAFRVRMASSGRLAHWVLAMACGLAAWTLVLVALAVADRFRPEVAGAVAWLVVLAWLAWRRPWSSVASRAPTPGASALVALLLLVVAGWLYAGWPKESLVAERDEAIYTLHAMHLLETGRNRIDMAKLGLDDTATAAAMASRKSLELPGIYPTGSQWTFQFSVAPSVWMAQLAATAGDAGLFRFNVLASVFSSLVLLVLLREWLPRGAAPWALFGMVMLAFNPAQLWVSRVNLSEPLAQCFTLSGLLFFLLALRRNQPRLALLAGLVLGTAVLVRIDSLLTILLVLAAYPLCVLLRVSDQVNRGTWAAMAAGMASMSALSILYFATQVSPYWQDHAGYLRPLAWAGIPLLLAAIGFASARLPALPRAWITAACSFAAACIVVAFAYAAFIRPYDEPFSLIDSVLVPQLSGSRDFRELSLHNLAAYLGWPLVVAALAGYLYALWTAGREGAQASTVLLLVVFLGASLAFLFNPMISPDHVWASRRFVPLVIPGTIVFAVAILAHCTRRLPWRGVVASACLLAATLGGQRLWDQRATLFFAEDAGLLQALRQLDARLPPEQRIVVTTGPTLAATLLAGFGKPALPLVDGDFEQALAAQADLESGCSRTSPCQWLQWPGHAYPGLGLQASTGFTLPRQRIEGSPTALAQATEDSRWNLALATLAGQRAVEADRLVGDHRDWRLPEHGFWQDEVDAFGSTRWTNGDAMLRVPALPVRALELTLQYPPDAATTLRLSVNDQVLFEGDIEGGRWRREFTPPQADADGYWTFRIQSGTFVAADRYGGGDRRSLGVKLESIRLLAPAKAPSWSPGSAFAADLHLLPAASPDTLPRRQLLGVRNTGDWSWPGLANLEPGESPVQLGVLWLARGDSTQGPRLLEQRLPLPRRLEPGEDVLVPLVLDPVLANGAKLPAGDYDVLVSPVLEGTAWFHDHGVTPLRIPVEDREFR